MSVPRLRTKKTVHISLKRDNCSHPIERHQCMAQEKEWAAKQYEGETENRINNRRVLTEQSLKETGFKYADDTFDGNAQLLILRRGQFGVVLFQQLQGSMSFCNHKNINIQLL